MATTMELAPPSTEEPEEAMMDLLSDLKDELTPTFMASGAMSPAKVIPAASSDTASVSRDTLSCKAVAVATVKPVTMEVKTCAAAREKLLWNVVATPAMMSAFSATVATSTTAVKA